MKIALIGQDIPMLLPALLTDLLFAGGEKDATVFAEEGNPAMAELLQAYGERIVEKAGKGGTFRVTKLREELLKEADCVIYAGDCQAASRFAQDREALGSDEENDPGLTDQARVNGGIEGLLHALRAGEMVLRLCEEMDRFCPEALVINLGQPVARTTCIFTNRGYRCFGLGRTPLRGANGVDAYAKLLQIPGTRLSARTAGLPGFAFLTEIRDGEKDLLDRLKRAGKDGSLGKLARRWLDWWDAVPVGDVTDHAEFLPAQEDYAPEERPTFGETVEKRKERILWMNTVREQGPDSREGAMAQLLLLSRAEPVRPMRLALALLRKESGSFPAVTRRNGKTLPQLSREAMIETDLELEQGEDRSRKTLVPEALAEILAEVDQANRLAAKAAEGDGEALREYIETDPALGGLDRLYCLEVTRALIRLHGDVLSRWSDGE